MQEIQSFDIPLENLVWKKIGSDPERASRLLTALNIGGLRMHLEAIAVERDDQGFNVALDSDRARDLESLEDMESGSFTTLEIDGKDYVLYATPACV